jgi:hypothetical protein
MSDLAALGEQATIVVLLVVVLWAGHKGWWYWSPGVRALTSELARERDDWRTVAITLMRKQGIELPNGFERNSGPRRRPDLKNTERE